MAPVEHGLGGIEQTPRFRAGLEHPVGGEWLDHVMIDRCGTQALENMLVTAADGQPPRIVALLPGTTEAGPLLQRDAQRIAFAVAALSAKRNGKDAQSCAATPRLIVIDTRFERRTATAAGKSLPANGTRPGRCAPAATPSPSPSTSPPTARAGRIFLRGRNETGAMSARDRTPRPREQGATKKSAVPIDA